MFGKWKNHAELRRGVEVSLTMSLFGIPEILVVHSKYENFLRKVLIEKSVHKIALVVLILDPDGVCTECASKWLKTMTQREYPNAEGIVNIKYFGVPQSYINEVTERAASY